MVCECPSEKQTLAVLRSAFCRFQVKLINEVSRGTSGALVCQGHHEDIKFSGAAQAMRLRREDWGFVVATHWFMNAGVKIV
ncbi:hypothetical protein P5673_017094 [Acropora cervicornis]|uniref:Uncharacterized protein n=1 Tax=Acropora cervicornis TaxID=6130 RepID=A0AAD9QF32_ACRCE|nr:hypothetical protein P5673_017094 [Acropora cervicornis]